MQLREGGVALVLPPRSCAIVVFGSLRMRLGGVLVVTDVHAARLSGRAATERNAAEVIADARAAMR